MNGATSEQTMTQLLAEAEKKAALLGRPVLIAISEQVRPADLLAVFESLAFREKVFLWLGTGTRSLLGAGDACTLSAAGASRFHDLSCRWNRLAEEAIVSGPIAPVALGGFRFDEQGTRSPLWREFSDGELTLPEYTILREGECWYRIRAGLLAPGEEKDASSFFRDVPAEHAASGRTCGKEDYAVDIHESPDAEERWNTLIARALHAIRRGELKKVVAARPLHLTASPSFPLASILRRMHRNNPAACTFAFGRAESCFLGATPEILFRAEGGFFRTMALAGSAPRGKTPEEDQRLGKALLSCRKEREEHEFVVREVQKTLEPLCRNIRVDAGPSLHRLPRVQHLITRFEGELKPGRSLLHIVERLHPTPAVGGLPSEQATAFLREHEGFDRGWYAGPVGWLDMKGDGEFMVALRSGLAGETHADLFAGCGIVSGSDAENEYRETGLKLKTMLDAVLPPQAAASSRD